MGSSLTYARRYAIPRLLGISADDDDDGNAAGHTITAERTRQASPNGHPPEPPARPTAEAIDRLFAMAESCREPKDLFGRRLREIMGMPGEVRISKKFLRESMTMNQFDTAQAYYENLLRSQVEENVPDGTRDPQGEPDAPEAAPAPVADGAVVPAVTTPPDAPGVASSAQLRDLRALALQVDPTGKAERDVVESFAHFPQGMPLTTYAEVHARLSRRLEEAKGGLAMAEA
jgi:hypothetical protein